VSLRSALPLRIGHAVSTSGRTGCTVVLCPEGAVGGVAVRGSSPGTRETDLLHPDARVDRVHAVVLTGGSAFGLASVDGVMRWLWERGYGWPTRVVPVPIVPAAVLFDLRPGEVEWPDATMGYAACVAATDDWPAEGREGAGTGATVGKVLGMANSSPGGIGCATLQLPDGTTVGAIVAVNASGHVVDPVDGRIVAGPRLPDGTFADSVEILLGRSPVATGVLPVANTTIGVVWTDARLDKPRCSRLASVAHDGLARAIRPVHTERDGDTLFALARPSLPTQPDEPPPPDLTVLGVAATEVVTRAIVRAVTISQPVKLDSDPRP